jgi:uncharacterized membrane protein YccC
MSIQEIENAVAKLSPEELSVFSGWFEEYVADQWDRQIERDAAAGRLNEALEEAEKHRKAGRCTQL